MYIRLPLAALAFALLPLTAHADNAAERALHLNQAPLAPVTDKTSSVEPAREVFHFAGESEAMQKAHARLSAQGIETHVVSSTDPLAPAKHATTG